MLKIGEVIRLQSRDIYAGPPCICSLEEILNIPKIPRTGFSNEFDEFKKENYGPKLCKHLHPNL